jgi:hypothetical protein
MPNYPISLATISLAVDIEVHGRIGSTTDPAFSSFLAIKPIDGSLRRDLGEL